MVGACVQRRFLAWWLTDKVCSGGGSDGLVSLGPSAAVKNKRSLSAFRGIYKTEWVDEGFHVRGG